ncbi:MAG: thioredoxin fold domain-containing protein, partial [Chromatiales bacterium]|nr:thioredoxin fold domain-containing protein [Chromatiales bacterium]
IVRYTRQHFNTVGLDVLGSRPMVALDGRQSSEREYAVRERLNFTPTLVFYDLDGHEALRLRGYQSPYQHRAALEYVVDAHYRNERFGDYLARADPPPKFEVGGLNQREFFAHPPYALDRSRIPARRPLVVFFEQRDCHACDVLHTEPLSDRQTLDSLALMEVVQLDMRSETPVLTPDGRRLTARQWARELDLFYAPTLIFFDERGREIIRVESVVRLNRLRNVLEYVLTRGYENYPTFQRWSASRSEMQ